MPSEDIGSVSTGDMPRDRAWIVLCLEMAMRYLQQVVGTTPGYQLEIIWHDHELGSYPSLGLTWEHPLPSPDDDLRRLEVALRRFDDAVDWYEIRPEALYEEFEELFGDEGEADEDESDDGGEGED